MRLEVRGLVKSFGKQRVLDGVDLSFHDIHSLALIGPSGGGKSTLLRILAGLESATAGSVEVNGVVLDRREETLRTYRRTVGTVFQAFNLFPHLTALRNLTLPLIEVHGLGPGAAESVAMDFLKRFQLDDHARKKPAELSGGQRQRVAIARALAVKPRLLFLDEPTSALDPEMTAEVLEMIAELRDEGRDFVLVTHEMGFARQVADQTVFLAGGRVVESGLSAEVFGSPRQEATRRFLAKILKY